MDIISIEKEKVVSPSPSSPMIRLVGFKVGKSDNAKSGYKKVDIAKFSDIPRLPVHSGEVTASGVSDCFSIVSDHSANITSYGELVLFFLLNYGICRVLY